MPESNSIRPTYAESFRCIGSECEDTCCQGWGVPIDQASYTKYQQLPTSQLRSLIDANILTMPEGAKPNNFAKIRMDGASQCPMLTADRLCRIQLELGESYLSHICATYPRIVHQIGGVQETALTLSCPEAARVVLLNPELLARELHTVAEQSRATIIEAAAMEGSSVLLPCFWPIRQIVLSLIGNRTYPLWQRLFLLGVLCRRLDSIGKGELERNVAEYLADFTAAVATGSLRSAMEALPLDRAAQLDVVLRMAGMMLHRSNVRPRFVECVHAFTTGIGNGPGATLESLTEHFTLAHDRYYAPYFGRNPHILENYLANTVLRCRFPFGKASVQTTMEREYALLTAQFALLKGFLIGVAGYHREAFSAGDVIHTVQATSKHFEHHPEFLELTFDLLRESRMDGARGLAILLRNAGPAAPKPFLPEIPATGPHPPLLVSE
ncbi:MAG: flagellin lysine-N-methylase [Terracidiphilus sp.]